jgi:hypothetical protein
MSNISIDSSVPNFCRYFFLLQKILLFQIDLPYKVRKNYSDLKYALNTHILFDLQQMHTKLFLFCFTYSNWDNFLKTPTQGLSWWGLSKADILSWIMTGEESILLKCKADKCGLNGVTVILWYLTFFHQESHLLLIIVSSNFNMENAPFLLRLLPYFFKWAAMSNLALDSMTPVTNSHFSG